MGIDARMFVKVRPPKTAAEVRALAVELAAAFGPDRFCIARQVGGGQHAVEIIGHYAQDGPDVLPEPGEQFLECHLCTRYYGPGYERGDLAFIMGVAGWFLHRLPGCEVWYGGDSSGVLAVRLDAAGMTALWTHFAGHRHQARGWEPDFATERQRCEFCDEGMRCCGGGAHGQYVMFRCRGCGLEVETRDGGATWRERKERSNA